jgi:hypothetical protein
LSKSALLSPLTRRWLTPSSLVIPEKWVVKRVIEFLFLRYLVIARDIAYPSFGFVPLASSSISIKPEY